MSADQIRHELERKMRACSEVETDVGKHRTKESTARVAADKARSAAAKTSNATTAKSKLSEADRREKEAATAASAAAAADKKAAGLRTDISRLQKRLSDAEASERRLADQRQKTADKRTERERTAERAEYERRIAAAEDAAREARSAVATATRSLPEPKPETLRVLLLGADGSGGLRIGREQQRIAAAVRSANHRDSISFETRAAATTDDLLDGISQFRPHVVHFSGHSNEDVLAFEKDVDAPNDGTMVAGTAFARAMSATDEPPTLVILNSCDSAAHLDALVGGIVPFAVGTTDSIGDGDAIIYATRFYASVANGHSIASAHEAGRVALEFAGLNPDIVVLQSAGDVDPTAAVLVRGSGF